MIKYKTNSVYNLSLVLPTRDRPHLVQRLLRSIQETAADPSAIEIVLYIDADDRESAAISSPLNLVKIVGPRTTMGAMTQACYGASHGRHIVLVNDDMVFRTRGWDVAVEQAFARHPDGVALVYADDGYYGKKLATFPILSRAVCDLIGDFAPAVYQRHSIDSHLFDIFERLRDAGHDRLIYLDGVLFEHMQHDLGMAADAAKPPVRHAEDQRRYFELAEERARIARKLAEHIRSLETALGRPSSVSLVIDVRGEGDAGRMEACLSSIGSSSGGQWPRIILAADASSPWPKLSRALRGRVQTHRSHAKTPGQMLNEAAALVGGDMLVFLDAGCIARPGWMHALLSAVSHPRVGAAGSSWLEPRSGRIEQAGLAFYEEAGGLRSTRLYRGLRADHPAANRSRSLQAVEWAGMLVRRRAFDTIGGFSMHAPGLEHIDICGKLRKEGFEIVLARDAAVERSIERVSPGIPSGWPFAIKPDLNAILEADGFTPAPKGRSAEAVCALG